jgi:uncharacterized protein (TIGR03085 family)
MMGNARDERLALCALLDEVGPREPTLCAGWATQDLAAHLVLRERRPDAMAGIAVGPLASYTRRVQHRIAERRPYPALVQTIRDGPPVLSPLRLPPADERVNLTEYFIHHEDVRRARAGWEPREIGQGLSDALWRTLRMARFVLRKVPVGVELARDDDGAAAAGVRITARARTPVVTVIGAPAELVLWVFGRTGAARVRLDGTEAAVAALQTAAWSV